MKIKLFYTLIIVALGNHLSGQDTKKVTVKNSNPKFKEVFYVLKSNKTIKHGKYKKYNFKNQLYLEGFYKNGVKDSLWVEHTQYNLKISNKGSYSNGKRTGIWKFYNYKGTIEQEYDYKQKKIISYKLEDRDEGKEYLVLNNIDSIKSKLDQPPIYIGGTSTIFKFLGNNLKFPPEAKANNISGKVFISFTIDSLGNTSDFQVEKKVYKILDTEALRVVKLLPSSWSPAILNKKAVSIRYEMPINFVLR